MLIFIKDLGMIKANELSKFKRRTYLVQCSNCEHEHNIQKGQFQAGYTEFCKACSILKRKGLI